LTVFTPSLTVFTPFGKNDSDTETVRHLVDALSDPAIGCVSGELRFVDEESSALQKELGAYWRYEKWIRRNEASVDSIPGVTGAIYAMRKHLYEPIPAGTLLDDVLIPLQIVLRGSRVVYEDQSIARDHASVDAKQEWRRKVRTLAGNWQLINLIPQAFIPIRNRIWIQFISHKFLRLIVPFALILALVSCAIIPSRGYRIIFYTQIAFYLCAVVPAWRKVRIFSIAHTFVLLNLAAIAGLWAWITGQAHKTWVRNSENEV
jgi:hypothetical protein